VRLAQYEIEGPVGSGASGTVFRAHDEQGRVVAIKVLHRLDRRAFERFEREKRLLQSLHEQGGFVGLLGSGSSSSGPYLVMPFLPGGTLRTRLQEGKLPVEESLEIVTQLARTLGRAHAQGIVHRDMKPENVLFSVEGEPLVADLGLAKHFDAEAEKTASLSKTGELRGTAGYAPIEQMEDAKKAGPTADVFALGAILYECLAGKPAFTGETLLALLAKVDAGDYEPLGREIPGWLARVVDRCLENATADRFQDGKELADALTAREAGAPARRRAPLVALAVVLVGAIVLTALLLAPGTTEPSPPPGPPAASAPPIPEGAPAWFAALPVRQRPARLPRGVVFGKNPGEYLNEVDGSVLVHVPGGPFKVGDRWRKAEGFFLGKYEVTLKQFQVFLEAKPGFRTKCEKDGKGGFLGAGRYYHDKGAYWKFPRGRGSNEEPAKPEHPVVQIWWTDALAYGEWAGLRLPTVDEWQKAAGWDPVTERAHVYPWGDDPPQKRLVGNLADASYAKYLILEENNLEPPKVVYDDGFERTAPVDAFPGSASSYGALELGGNVREWAVAPYEKPRHTEKPIVDLGRKLIYLNVGGCFSSYPAEDTCKVLAEPEESDWPCEDIGFRVARSEE
jgi:formylglycine-generating enzyme required for sulfatase activity